LVRLSPNEQQELRRLLQSGLQPVRTVLRTFDVRQLADGQLDRQVAKNVYRSCVAPRMFIVSHQNAPTLKAKHTSIGTSLPPGHKARQGLRHPLNLGISHLRVQRQRQNFICRLLGFGKGSSGIS
jgi:hypothetical protein